MMTAKPDETEPCNSPLVGGTLKSRPENPLPFGLGVLCCPIEQLSHPRQPHCRVRAKESPGPLARGFPYCGADDGNRTRVICLEGRGSTIELHPRTPEGDTQDPSVKRPRARHLESPPV